MAVWELEAMWDMCEGVYYGTISKTKTYDFEWDLEDRTEPIETVLTDYNVEVEKVYKGEDSTRKFVFHDQGGEGSKMIVNCEHSKAYVPGYTGFFFLADNGTCFPYMGVKDGKITVPSYITLPEELAAKEGNTTFTVEEFGAILESYAK